ncbi:hypothetical protein A3I56_00500 [Candidatus Roizmanbacteria bacterium RIFCSPLOWO2_02_FULL_43_10]|uniref:Uncharacterized protein n=1 Tax=Candidatus Roizmanbacteria bacterium RIFCSPLOWO2_02_FULL_43_10 TaxID=1802078 RepID=A0A1F7K1N8_9BACT|nr:MAG: hypothetical protein A3I56_00500 [Candidatus Roizmanbacteria bacterium RIFCSPLOWO2_02_FULL_43_10]
MTLSEFSYYFRKIGPFALAGLILFIIFYVLISGIITAIVNRPRDIPYEPPLGILDPIPFSYTVDYPSSFTLTMENIEGRPTTATSAANVYFIPQARTRFGYQQTTTYMARAVGFDTETQQYTINGLEAQYDDGIRKLKIDITNFNFTFETDLQQIDEIFSTATIPQENTIREQARAFMRQMNKYDENFAQGKDNVIYLRYDLATQDFIVVQNPQEANVVEVDFFQPDVNGYPVMSPKYFNSQNYVTFVFRPEGNLVIKAQVTSFPKDYSTGGAYPLKTGDRAFEELLNRKGIIVSPAKGSSHIVIRDMFVGYYDPEVYFPYLMPVYVFLGDNGFAAYVSAVDPTYIKTATESAPITPTKGPREALIIMWHSLHFAQSTLQELVYLQSDPHF